MKALLLLTLTVPLLLAVACAARKALRICRRLFPGTPNLGATVQAAVASSPAYGNTHATAGHQRHGRRRHRVHTSRHADADADTAPYSRTLTPPSRPAWPPPSPPGPRLSRRIPRLRRRYLFQRQRQRQRQPQPPCRLRRRPRRSSLRQRRAQPPPRAPHAHLSPPSLRRRC